MADPRAELIQYLQARLRQTGNLHFRPSQVGDQTCHTLIIGRATWTSLPCDNATECRKRLAAQALEDVASARNETELRARLGLPHRPHSRICDSIRDQLRAEKQRLKQLPPTEQREAQRMKIVEVYIEIDKLEKMMINLGLEN